MTDSPSMRAVSAVAEAKGVDVVDLPPINDAIDPDALDALFDPGPNGTRDGKREYEIRFSYAGLNVLVRGDGDVTVETNHHES